MGNVTDAWHDIKQDLKRQRAEVTTKDLKKRPPAIAKLKPPLPPEIEERLRELGISKLYAHQVDAIGHIRDGKNVVITSATAGGKSLCYVLPLLEAFKEDNGLSAMCIYPTKALGHDQQAKLEKWETPGLMISDYDGDTPSNLRAWARANANIIFTNPDMLSAGILPNHQKWGPFLKRLRFVFIDEVHVYKGVFGSNVGLVIRRLRRLLERAGANPVFILASATIANPRELAQELTGLSFVSVDDEGARRGSKTFALVNPPMIDRQLGIRKSSNMETTAIFRSLVESGVRTIAFSRSRRSAELIYKYLLTDKGFKYKKKVQSYRAGYTPQNRRKIEKALFSGELLGVSATNALELGIDIGELEATVMNGYPGTIASLWQQAGRSGRKDEHALSVLIAGADPLDQYVIKHQEYIFGKPFEMAFINTGNPYILQKHLLAALMETPFTKDDLRIMGGYCIKALEELARQGLVRQSGDTWYALPSAFNASMINLRSTSQDLYQIVEGATGELIASVDDSRAFFEVHEGALYLHMGRGYLVTALDLMKKVAFVEECDEDHFTQPLDKTNIEVIEVLEERSFPGCGLFFGTVTVETHVNGFVRRSISGGEILGFGQLDLPTMRFETEAFWYVLTPELVEELALGEVQLAGAIHAAEHATIGLMPFFAMADRSDIGGVSTPFHYQTEGVSIFVYDAYEGGVGIARAGFERFTEVIEATRELIETCECAEGCPSCIQSPKCGNMNEPLFKKGAELLLGRLCK